MVSEKRALIISKTCRQLGLHPAPRQIPRIEVVDDTGHTYHFKYRTVGERGTTAFDFSREELDAPFDFLLGIFVAASGEIVGAIRVRHGDLHDMVNVNESKFCLRWNDDNRNDTRIECLNPH